VSPIYRCRGPNHPQTVTIVEAILQLLVRDPGTRILACAPSNSASDLITERLLDSGELNSTTLLRAFAPSRPPQSVNRADVRECALRTHQPDGPFRVPTLDEVKSRRVVVATCVGAAFPLNLGMERGHFTHIFVDEAAQVSVCLNT
jgi:helicase MOV-10